jgi:hypothetical protein
MNYLKHYIKLMRKAKNRSKLAGYTEKHHIFPTSIFGKNDSIAILTAKEHYIAHMLLFKACYNRYGENHYKTKKMAFAWWNMTFGHKGKRRTSNSFSIAKEKMSIALSGEGNPSKNPGVGDKISETKKGKPRPDMKGKAYFGACEESRKNGISKMIEKKTGMKINYPKNRNSPPCSQEKAILISEMRKKTKDRFIEMTNDEFLEWIEKQKLYAKDGKRKNSNVTRVLKWRNIPIEEYYEQ